MPNQVHAFRLGPGADLRAEIELRVKQLQIQAGWIVTCVGSLSRYHLRFANQPGGKSGDGHFEIVSLVGTLGTAGCHLHTSISDQAGATIGGHVLEGCIIYTTAELVIGSENQFIFDREEDPKTGWRELKVKPK
jgi:predicted DNA-binding protein with PD1-like motif